MMKLMMTLMAGVALMTAHAADAAQFELFNTGVDNAHAVLGLDAIDTHYTIVSSNASVFAGLNGPSAPVGATYAKDSTGNYPISPGVWLGDNTDSRWIVPTINYFFGDQHPTTDEITYRTTFDLTGFDPTTASIAGHWSVDDTGMEIRLNGVAVSGVPIAQYNMWKDFTITSGFQSGVNTLEFVSLSTLNPTGLRVEMTGSAAAVPEPATWALMIGGLGLVGASLRRRTTVTAVA